MARVRRQAAALIDKLLALREKGANPPLIGFVQGPDGSRFVSLAEELERWRNELRLPPPAGRLRHQKNDPHLGHRQAMSAFRAEIERAFGSPVVADALAERFANLIRYANAAAQVSR